MILDHDNQLFRVWCLHLDSEAELDSMALAIAKWPEHVYQSELDRADEYNKVAFPILREIGESYLQAGSIRWMTSSAGRAAYLARKGSGS